MAARTKLSCCGLDERATLAKLGLVESGVTSNIEGKAKCLYSKVVIFYACANEFHIPFC